MNGRLLLDDSRRTLRAPAFRVALHQIEALDEGAVIRRKHANDLSGLPALAPGNHHDGVVLSNTSMHDVAHKTSGARDRIFMNFFARNSRATGPKMRVPTGSRWLSISTAEFESNLMYEPSARPTS